MNRTTRGRYDSLAQSFMFLSFITTALLITIQTWGSSFESAESVESISEGAQPIVAFPEAFTEAFPESPASSSSTPVGSAAPGTPASSKPSAKQQGSVPVQTGVAAALQPALPTLGMTQSLELVVDLSERHVSLYSDGVMQVRYPIAIGRAGWETPTGEFHVLSMQPDPVWQNPITGEIVPSGSGNPLGSRWIGFWIDGIHQIGFHGTYQEELIGQAVSHGCIRMRNADVEALYAQVGLGTPVTVIP